MKVLPWGQAILGTGRRFSASALAAALARWWTVCVVLSHGVYLVASHNDSRPAVQAGQARLHTDPVPQLDPVSEIVASRTFRPGELEVTSAAPGVRTTVLPALPVPPGLLFLAVLFDAKGAANAAFAGARVFWSNPAGEFVGDYWMALNGSWPHLSTATFNPDFRGTASTRLRVRVDVPASIGPVFVQTVDMVRVLVSPSPQLSRFEERTAFAMPPARPLVVTARSWGTGAFRTAIGVAGIEEVTPPVALDVVITVTPTAGGGAASSRTVAIADVSGRTVFAPAWTPIALDLSPWLDRDVKITLAAELREPLRIAQQSQGRFTLLWESPTLY